MNLLEKIFQNLKKNYQKIVVNEINPISLKIKELLDDKIFLKKYLKMDTKKLMKLPQKK